MKFSETHPIWKLARLVIVMSFLTLILWLQASSFDETELRVLAWMVVGIMGLEFAPNAIAKAKQMAKGEV